MTFDALLTLLRECDARVHVEKHELRVLLPENADSDKIRDALRAHKGRLISALTGDRPPETSRRRPAIPARANTQPVDVDPTAPTRSALYPLSASQQRFWTDEPLEPWTPKPFLFRIRGALDREVLSAAVLDLTRRHPVLRSRIHTATRPVVQSFDAPHASMEAIDLSRASRRARRSSDIVAEIVERETGRAFDLAAGRVFYTTLYALGPKEFVFALNPHHIAFDGWSLHLACEALSEGCAGALPAPSGGSSSLPPTYGDFIRWEQSWMASAEFRRRQDYWVRRMAEVPLQRFLVPAARARGDGAVVSGTLAETDVHALGERAATSGVTLPQLCLAAFSAALCERYALDDLVIGCPAANRLLQDWDRVIGCFADVQPFRIQLDGSRSIQDLVDQIRQLSEAAAENAGVSSRSLFPEDDTGRPPRAKRRFRFMYNYLFTGFPTPRVPACEVEWIDWDYTYCDGELSLLLVPRERAVRLYLNYDRTLVSRNSAESLLEAVLAFLRAVGADPSRAIRATLTLGGHAETHHA